MRSDVFASTGFTPALDTIRIFCGFPLFCPTEIDIGIKNVLLFFAIPRTAWARFVFSTGLRFFERSSAMLTIQKIIFFLKTISSEWGVLYASANRRIQFIQPIMVDERREYVLSLPMLYRLAPFMILTISGTLGIVPVFMQWSNIFRNTWWRKISLQKANWRCL